LPPEAEGTAVIKPELPEQIVVSVAVTVGAAVTVTVPLAVAEQPNVLVTVTVYVVVVVGDTVMLLVVLPPGDQR
jgi:hypothetical protein